MNPGAWAPGGIDVCFASLTVTDAVLESGIGALSADERARASRFVQRDARRRFIVSHALLRAALSARTGIEAAALEFHSAAQGKPVLARERRIEFSMARADDVAAFAFGVTPVGIDLVAESSGERVLEAAAEFCSPAERRSIAALGRARRIEALLRIWARKEALLKASGEGLMRSPRGITVWTDDLVGACRVLSGEVAWVVHDISAPAGYRAALAHPLA